MVKFSTEDRHVMLFVTNKLHDKPLSESLTVLNEVNNFVPIISAFLDRFRSYSACKIKPLAAKKQLVSRKTCSKSQETEYAARVKENNIHICCRLSFGLKSRISTYIWK